MLPRAESLHPILRPHDAIYRPAGEGRFPAVILMHGCAGVRRKDVQWAETFREQGYVALVVDSLSGRGIMYLEVGHAFDWRESAATTDARERVRAFLAGRLKT